MKTKFRVIVDDPLAAESYGLTYENVEIKDEPFFLAGPVAQRVAIVDRDPASGQLKPPLPWLSSKRQYVFPADMTSPQGIALSVFGLVLKTLEMYEKNDVLGHKVKWAFDSPQLLVVPNAGIWKNAFYDRYSHSLQYFSFTGKGNKEIHTACSRDIITHETGHAIFDGLAPALYDALTPQSLALHEAIGDLTAMVMSLRSRRIQEWLIKNSGGRLREGTPISKMAEEFGQAIGLSRPLRDANEVVKMDKNITNEPHDLCRVLTGAFWAAMVQIHNNALDKAARASEKPDIGKTLAVSALHIGRILFRALDYLAPAETTFADYCRAVLRADEVGYPVDKDGYREVLKQAFIDRGIITDAAQLECTPKVEYLRVNLNDILESEWYAYAFAEKNRKLLEIPKRVPFRLFPRRDVKRRYILGPKKFEDRREVVFQLTWEQTEENTGVTDAVQKRGVFHGTTLVIGGKPDKRGRYPVLSCLTTDRSDAQKDARTETLRQFIQRGQLDIVDKWRSFNARPLEPKVMGRVADKVLRLRGTARLIQLTELTS